jgi:hypothetical protein
VGRNWAESKGKQGREQRISGEMGCFLAGRGLIDGGSVDVDFLDGTIYSDYILKGSDVMVGRVPGFEWAFEP